MQELEHVLDSLLHDVRGPLGVVGGYLRLLREGKVSDPAQMERAIGKAQDALRTVSEICAEAGAWLPRATAAPPIDVRVADFLDAVAATAAGTNVERVGIDGDARLRLALPLDRVAGAIVALMRLGGRAEAVNVRARLDEGQLWLETGSEARAAAVGPFDPWQHPGLSVPLARHVVVSAGGACLADPADPARPLVQFAVAA